MNPHPENIKYNKCASCGYTEENIKEKYITDWRMLKMSNVNWNDVHSRVSKHFTVKECLWLPSWNRIANETDGLNDNIKNNLIILCTNMDKIREFLDASVNVHVTYRPAAYNKQIGGSLNSAHIKGLAMDFDVGDNCDVTRNKILQTDLLDKYDMYMENKPGSGWVHLNCNDGVKRFNRFFTP